MMTDNKHPKHFPTGIGQYVTGWSTDLDNPELMAQRLVMRAMYRKWDEAAGVEVVSDNFGEFRLRPNPLERVGSAGPNDKIVDVLVLDSGLVQEIRSWPTVEVAAMTPTEFAARVAGCNHCGRSDETPETGKLRQGIHDRCLAWSRSDGTVTSGAGVTVVRGLQESNAADVPFDVPVYQLDGFVVDAPDDVIDPDSDGYGVMGGTDVAEHWRCGPMRRVRVHLRLESRRVEVARLLRDMLRWVDNDDVDARLFGWRDDETLVEALRRDKLRVPDFEGPPERAA